MTTPIHHPPRKPKNGFIQWLHSEGYCTIAEMHPNLNRAKLWKKCTVYWKHLPTTVKEVCVQPLIIIIYSYILQFDLLMCTASPHKLYNLQKFGKHTFKAVCPLQCVIYNRFFKYFSKVLKN